MEFFFLDEGVGLDGQTDRDELVETFRGEIVKLI